MFIFIRKFCLFILFTTFYINFCKADCSNAPNKYVWKAALEIVKTLPLRSADPYGGVIITDWFEVNDYARYKVDVYVLSGILNSQSVRVSVFKQIKNGANWNYTPISSEISNKIEENILNEAKKLRLVSNFK